MDDNEEEEDEKEEHFSGSGSNPKSRASRSAAGPSVSGARRSVATWCLADFDGTYLFGTPGAKRAGASDDLTGAESDALHLPRRWLLQPRRQ